MRDRRDSVELTRGLVARLPRTTLERFVRLASSVGGDNIAFLTLVDQQQQQVLEQVGLPEAVAMVGPAEQSVCQFAMQAAGAFAIEDLRADPRTALLPSVQAGQLRSYLGASYGLSLDEPLGALCVASRSPCQWSDVQRTTVADLAELLSEAVRLLRLHERLRAQERLLDATFHSIEEGVLVTDAAGVPLFFNRAMQKLHATAIPKGPVDEWARQLQLFLPDRETPYPPQDILAARALRGEHVPATEVVIRRPNGEALIRSVTAAPLHDEQGNIEGAVVVSRDVTQERRAADAIATQRRIRNAILEHLPYTVALWFDLDLVLAEVTGTQSTRFVDPEVAIGQSLREVVSTQNRDKLEDMARAALAGKAQRHEVRYPGLALALDTAPTFDDAGNVSGVLLLAHDITTREKERADLELRATTDALTGLLNRDGFMRAAQALLSPPAKVTAAAHTLFSFDLNGFKSINDTLGHAAGDLALQAFARLLRATFRAPDLLARFGGDEFVVLAQGCDEHGARAAEARLHDALASSLAEVTIVGKVVRLRSSFGAAALAASLDSSVETKLTEALAAADAAMYANKTRR
jgi:diguanylate cyclase (GGDEF)-like protein